jgi:hypothetical protein
MFDDDRAGFGSQDLITLPEDKLHQARIFAGLLSQLKSCWRGSNLGQIYQPSFRFGDNFLSQDENVTILELQLGAPSSSKDHGCQVISLLNKREFWKRCNYERQGVLPQYQLSTSSLIINPSHLDRCMAAVVILIYTDQYGSQSFHNNSDVKISGVISSHPNRFCQTADFLVVSEIIGTHKDINFHWLIKVFS